MNDNEPTRFLWEGDVPASGDRKASHAGGASLVLHGTPRVEYGDGRTVQLESKSALLLAWLAFEGPTRRSRLSALLSPESDSDHAHAALRQRRARLKRSLGFDPIGAGDLAALSGLVVASSGDEGAILLAGIEPDADSEIGAWLAGRRNARRGERAESLAAQAAQAEAAGELAAALRHAQALVDLDPSSEHSHRRVMRLHYARGDAGAALAAYERCTEALERLLGVPASRETQQLARQIGAAQGSAAPAPARMPVPVTLLRTPRMIGRDDDWRALSAAWDDHVPSLVIGDPGMGKTRLIGDFTRSRSGIVMVDARPGDARAPYALLSRLLRQVLARLAESPPRGVVEELARLLPELGPAQPIGSSAERARFLNAIDAALHAATTQGVSGIAVDDLQFADAASIEVLQRLLAGGLGLRWIVAYRPVELSPEALALCREMLQTDTAHERRLAPLTATQIAELIESLDIAELDAATLAPALARHTGGNPLFLLETLKAMMTGPTRGQDAAKSSVIALPAAANVVGLIGRRIERLSGEAIRIARCAAVAGQDFSSELAAQVLGVKVMDLVDGWAELEAAQVLRDGAFVHDLIHDAALASVPVSIATQLHAEIAAFLEAKGIDPGRIAIHWLEGGQPGRALPYMKAAALAARQALMVGQASYWYGAAVDHLERCGDADAGFELWQDCVKMLAEVSHREAERQALARLERLARTPRQRARAACMRCYYTGNAGGWQASLVQAREALAWIERQHDPLLYITLEVHIVVSLIELERMDEASALLDTAMPHLEQLLDSPEAAEVHNNLGVMLGQLDRREDAARMLRKAAEIGVQRGPLSVGITSLVNLGVNRSIVGRSDAAIEALESAWRLMNAMAPEDRPPFANAARMLAHASHCQGDYARAVPLIEQAIALGETQAPQYAVPFLTTQGRIFAELGQFARARQCFTAIRAKTSPAPRFLVSSRIAEFWLTWAMGKPDRALLEEAWSHVPPKGRASLAMQITLTQAQWLDDIAACDKVRLVREEARKKELFGIVLNAEVQLARLLLHADSSDVAAQHARAALTLLESYSPEEMYRGEVWLAAFKALRAAGDPLAREALTKGVAWLRNVAQNSVPAEFRDSFLNRNPVNLELLRHAARELVFKA